MMIFQLLTERNRNKRTGPLGRVFFVGRIRTGFSRSDTVSEGMIERQDGAYEWNT